MCVVFIEKKKCTSSIVYKHKVQNVIMACKYSLFTTYTLITNTLHIGYISDDCRTESNRKKVTCKKVTEKKKQRNKVTRKKVTGKKVTVSEFHLTE